MKLYNNYMLYVLNDIEPNPLAKVIRNRPKLLRSGPKILLISWPK